MSEVKLIDIEWANVSGLEIGMHCVDKGAQPQVWGPKTIVNLKNGKPIFVNKDVFDLLTTARALGYGNYVDNLKVKVGDGSEVSANSLQVVPYL